jgi:hypothetical protein
MEISVNQKTTTVGKAKLHFTLFIYLFHRKKMGSITILEGVAGKRIVSANLRPQKNHFITESSEETKRDYPDWTFIWSERF